MRVLQGRDALLRLGEEATALGARALVVSAAQPDPRESIVLEKVRRQLQAARIGQQPFPRVPREDEPTFAARDVATEAAREGHCRMVLGVGDDFVLDVARAAAAGAWLPSLVVPTVLGYGRAAASNEQPLPDVLMLDPAACAGSPPRRTAARGVRLLLWLLDAHAGCGEGTMEAEAALEEAMRGLIDALPGAVRSPEDLPSREMLAAAVGKATEGMGPLGVTDVPLERLWRRLAGRADPDAVAAAMLPAALEVAAARNLPVPAARLARFGREVLGIREEDDGRAAQWAAGGVRQWVRGMGCSTRLTIAAGAVAGLDEAAQEILAVMKR